MKRNWVNGGTVPRTLNLDGKSSEMLHFQGTSPHNTLKRRVRDRNLTTLTTKSSLTFIYPCIANIFSGYNQQDATFLKCIYSCKTLYMFQMVFPSIIRSSKPHIQRQVFVRPLLLPAASLDGMVPSHPFEKCCILLLVL